MNKIFLFTSILIGLFYLSCDISENKQLYQTLELAGENRTELEKVLSHYDKPNDSLKLKAAKFLITNMTHHFSRQSPKIDTDLDEALKLVDSTIKKLCVNELEFNNSTISDSIFYIKKRLFEIIEDKIIRNKSSINPDLKTIKGNWLIKHIDRSFLTWNNSKLLDSDNFSEFSETLLPYRLSNEILNAPSNFSQELLADNLFSNIDFKDAKAVINRLNLYLKKIRLLSADLKLNHDIGFYNLINWRNLECDNQSIIQTKILNDLGIPTFSDLTPQWLNRSGGHSWCNSKDSTGVYKPFSCGWQSIDPTETDAIVHRINYFKRASKIYRRVYSFELNSAYYHKGDKEDIPSFFNTPYLKDVSDEYHKTIPLSIPLKPDTTKNKIAYLSIFSKGQWMPVGWGRIDRKKMNISFEKVPVNVCYVVGLYQRDKIIPITNPFYLDNNGKKHNIIPDKNIKTSIKIYRKYPEKERLRDFRNSLIGAKFQGANKPDFSDAVNLYEFTSTPKEYVKEIPIKITASFKYVRFLTSKRSDMAIMEYYSKRKKNIPIIKGTSPYVFNIKDTVLLNRKDVTKLSGKLISKVPNTPIEILIKGFDGNMETVCTAQWAGIDFGKPEKIEFIRYASRNGNNMINVGDLYELLYYDKAWKSLGTIEAQYNYLTFDEVPSNAMFWLRNLSKGKEELPFIYVNGKQFFVNNDVLEPYLQNRVDHRI